MAEAVIVAASRTPIGRAVKGSLATARPDDLSSFIIDDVLNKVPDLPRDDVEDVIWGIGQPAGEGGYNIARVCSIMAGLEAPGVTVNRYCSSSLQTIRMAAHAGSKLVKVTSLWPAASKRSAATQVVPPTWVHTTRRSQPPRPARAERSAGGADTWVPEGTPDIYIAMGQTAENVAQLTGIDSRAPGRMGRSITESC